MSKERRVKHETTPLPNRYISKPKWSRLATKVFDLIRWQSKKRWQSFRSKNLDDNRKSKGTEDFNPVHCDKIEDIVGRMNDAFQFASDTSWSPSGSDTSEESSWSTVESDSGEDSIWNAEGTDTSNETIEFFSPEKLRFRDSVDSTIPFRDFVFSSTKIEDLNIGNPKFSSTGIQGADSDTHFNDSTITGSSVIKSRNFVDSYWANPENTSHRSKKGKGDNFTDSPCRELDYTSPKTPIGIDYIKTPPLEDFDYEINDEVLEVRAISPIPIPLKAFVNEEDESRISKFSEEEESLELGSHSFGRETNNFQGEHSVEFLTTINSSDVVDDVLKSSNDTRSLELNDAMVQMTFSEEYQTLCDIDFQEEKRRKRKRKRKSHVMPESTSVTENQDSNLKKKKRKYKNWWKRRVALKSASVTENPDSKLVRRKSRNRRNKTGSKMARNKEYVQYLRTLEVCPLSLSTTPFADSKGSVYITGDGNSTEKKSSRRKRRGKRTQVKDEGEWNEYKKYLHSIPVCPLSIKKTLLSASEEVENESG